MSKKVLLINKTNPATIIPEMLAAAGCEVTGTYDASAGVHQLESGTYDLVILMENAAVESWTLCAKVRRLTNAPFIVVSSGASAESCVKAIAAGADFFLRKPFGPMELMARVNSLFQRTQSRQPVALVS